MDSTVLIHPDDQERSHAGATEHDAADSATAIGTLLGPDPPRARNAHR